MIRGLSGARAVILSMVLLVAGAGSSSPSRAAGTVGFRPGEIVVRLNPALGATIDQINAIYGTALLAPVSGVTGAYRLRVPQGQTPDGLAATLALDARLLYAQPNFLLEAPEANPRGSRVWGGPDPRPYHTQYAGTLINLPAAQRISRGGGTVIAVIDTGMQLAHPALAGHLSAARKDFIDGDNTPEDVGNGIDDDADGEIDEAAGHGTHVAGIALFVAPDARIMPIRALDADGFGDSAQIAEAIQFAVDNRADVINLSLGSSADAAIIGDAVRNATEAGVIVSAAAGNLNSKDKQFPGADNCALGVASVGPTSVRSAFSNYGSWVDLSAPGESIQSALPPDGYGTWSGTSMAAPFVSGAAALVQAQRRLNAREMASLFALTTRSIDSVNPGFAGDLGRGLLDTGAALAFVRANSKIPIVGGALSGSCIEGNGGAVGQPGDGAIPVTLKLQGVVQTMPEGLLGTWVVSGISFAATERTRFGDKNGAMRIGACVHADVRDGVARQIRTMSATTCARNR